MSKTQWLVRRIAAAGPHLALVLSQLEFDAALLHCGVPPGVAWLQTPHSDATAHWLTNQKGELVCVVALGPYDGRNAIEIAGLLVHEAVHVWQQYAERIGERNPGVEQEAYAVQCIAQELMAEFARRQEAP